MIRLKKSLILGFISLVFLIPLRADDNHKAVIKGDLSSVKVMLLKNPELLNAKDEYGRMPLNIGNSFSLSRKNFTILIR